MNKAGFTTIGLVIASVSAVSVEGAEAVLGERTPSRSRFSFQAGATLGIKADFRNLGGFGRQTDPGAAAAGAEHFYDDGYNRVDSSANAGGQTWFWGYQNAAQTTGGNLRLNSSTAPATGRLARDDQPLPGLEFSVDRSLGAFARRGLWGIKVSLGWMGGQQTTTQGFTADVTQLTDSYALGGIVTPAPGFQGTFAGPHPTISDAPVRSTAVVANGALTTGRWSLASDIFHLRLGPWVEVPWGQVRLQGGAGLLGLVADSRFSADESTTVASIVNPVAGVSTTQTFSGSTRGTSALGGAYVEGAANWSLRENLALSIGVTRQWAQSQTQRLGAREGRLGMDQVWQFKLGLSYSF